MNNEGKFNRMDLSIAYIQKKSKLYKAGGYKKVKRLKRNRKDYEDHFYAFLVDVNFTILPVYIWFIEFFLILSGIITPKVFDLLFYVMYALLFVTSVIVVPVVTARTKGQTFGYYWLNLKIVKKNHHEVSPLTLILRQVVGFGIPIMVFGYFFKVWGVLLWWMINGIVVVATPEQQGIMDLLLGLYTVREPEYNIQIEQEQPEKNKVKEENVSPIDLHIRSNYSDDGYYDVEEIFKQAKDRNIDTISITDHNCARQNAAAQRFADLYDIHYIPGVEIDAQYRGVRVRVLGYYIDWNHKIFNDIETESLRREKSLSLQRVRKFEETTGIKIDVESLISNSRFQTITADDITSMVFHNQQVRALPFVKKFLDENQSEQKAMLAFKKRMFGKGGPCFVDAKYPELEEVIAHIHHAQGMAILASWHTDYMDDDFIEEMMDLGMDGMECFSPLVHQETTMALLQIAQRNQLFVTCGSDFHGPTKPNRHLGQTNCPEKGIKLVRILTKLVN